METQLESFEKIFANSANTPKSYNALTNDKFTRFIVDRRTDKGLQFLKKKYGKTEDISKWSVLVVCGGLGGEAMFFLRHGFKNVTNSDFSANAVKISKTYDARLKGCVVDAENIPFEDNSFDLVVVKDGLHHLPRPVLGMTEMIRVSKKAVIVIEPYESLIGNLIGTEWELQEGSMNYVFRWNRAFVNQVTKSYLLKDYNQVKVFRLWDHNMVMHKLARIVPQKWKYSFAKMAYSLLSIFNFCGNMMVAVVCKK
jgi:ubiquinone/menaquinone biosynthesis C-methylase UbiE